MTTEISEAAKAKAREFANINNSATFNQQRIARFIQEVSDAAKIVTTNCGPVTRSQQAVAPFILPEPVDPLLIEAREIVATYWRENNPGHPIIDDAIVGRLDGTISTVVALAALRRGIEIGGGK